MTYIDGPVNDYADSLQLCVLANFSAIAFEIELLGNEFNKPNKRANICNGLKFVPQLRQVPGLQSKP